MYGDIEECHGEVLEGGNPRPLEVTLVVQAATYEQPAAAVAIIYVAVVSVVVKAAATSAAAAAYIRAAAATVVFLMSYKTSELPSGVEAVVNGICNSHLCIKPFWLPNICGL